MEPKRGTYTTDKDGNNVFTGSKEKRYDVLDAQKDGKYPVRDGNGYPLKKSGGVDWNKVLEEKENK